MKAAVPDIDTYIAAFSEPVKVMLEKLRTTIRLEVPQASEAIKYGMPTFVYQGNLVHFAGYTKHIGFYPGASGVKAFQEELSVYPTSKGTVHFSLDEPLPLDLIRRMVRFRVAENETILERRKAKKRS